MIDFACKRFDLREIIKCSLGLSKADLRVFEALLRAREPLSSDAVARQLHIDVTTAQRALKRLLTKGLLVRSQRNIEGGGYLFAYTVRERKEIRAIISRTVHAWVARVDDELRGW